MCLVQHVIYVLANKIHEKASTYFCEAEFEITNDRLSIPRTSFLLLTVSACMII